MFKLQLFKARSLCERIVTALDDHGWRAYALIGVTVLVNLLILIAYQHRVGADFPFQDEWGYVNRVQQLPETGFAHYLFDKYQTYFMPMFMLVWYLFYRLAHLDFMTMRYTGALISASVSFLLCLMLYGKAPRRPSFVTLLAVLCAPFVVCSLNHAATLNQSIESVAEPLLFGVVLAISWAAEGTLRSRQALLWTAACVVGGLVAAGIYAPGLALLPAIVGARFVLYRRFDWPLIVLGVISITLPIWYVINGHGLEDGMQAPGLAPGDIIDSFKIWVGLSGNTLFTPVSATGRDFTRVLGLTIVIVQAVAMVHVLRRPVEERKRFLVPVVLSLYNTVVFVEILAARFHYPDVAFVPRYSIHMLGGAVSLLFWAVMLVEVPAWTRWLTAGSLVLVISGFVAADHQGRIQVDYTRHSMAGVRATLMALQAEPTAQEQKEMFIQGAGIVPFVYPGRLFLEQNRLAMYSGKSDSESPTQPH